MISKSLSVFLCIQRSFYGLIWVFCVIVYIRSSNPHYIWPYGSFIKTRLQLDLDLVFFLDPWLCPVALKDNVLQSDAMFTVFQFHTTLHTVHTFFAVSIYIKKMDYLRLNYVQSQIISDSSVNVFSVLITINQLQGITNKI